MCVLELRTCVFIGNIAQFFTFFCQLCGVKIFNNSFIKMKNRLNLLAQNGQKVSES